jgi:predicted nucleotidyltransferase
MAPTKGATSPLVAESEPIEAQALRILLASSLLQTRRVLGVWLFGSQSDGTAGPASDIDLGVLCQPALGLGRTQLMDSLSRDLGVEADIIDLATAGPTLAWEVFTTGRLLHETDELEVERIVRQTRFDAEDAAQRNRMILLAQVPSIGGRAG